MCHRQNFCPCHDLNFRDTLVRKYVIFDRQHHSGTNREILFRNYLKVFLGFLGLNNTKFGILGVFLPF